MNIGKRDNTIRSDNAESKKSGGKTVQFSRQMISDIFFIERIEKKRVKELFYSEKDIIGFQIDAMQKGERKRRRNREKQAGRSNSDGMLESYSRKETDENDSRIKGKRSKKSGKKKSKDNARRRYSNDDAHDYEPRDVSDESRVKKCRDPVANKKRSSKRSKSGSGSKRRESSSSDSSCGSSRKSKDNAERQTLTQDQLLEKAMQWRKAANNKDDSDKLDKETKPKDVNVALEPWTQDMLVSKAKEWKETITGKVAATTPEKKLAKPSEKTKQMAFLLARDAKNSVSSTKLPEELPVIKPPVSVKIDEPVPPKRQVSSSTRDMFSPLAREAVMDSNRSNSLEDLPLSDNDNDDDDDDDEDSMELSDLALEVNVTESMHLSQNDLLAEAIEKQKAKEEAANPLNKLRGFAKSIMVTQAFQNLTMESEAT